MGKSKSEQNTPSGIPTTKEKQDEAIIGTNDYSIVSKRSVEKIYYNHEPAFLEPFVGKFKRRAPLINKGYWLRMQAVEQVVRKFLDEKSENSKTIVNLGCGYEPLPFRMLWKYASKCRTVKFVDVDYPQLIQKKVEIIRKRSIFSDLLSGNQSSSADLSSSILMNDEKYCAVGCDLGDIKALDHIFRTELELEDSPILFIGEVSIVYMEVKSAEKLIEWTSTFKHAQFCLLEQHVPESSDHPFAKTMIEHFNKQTPLRCLSSYATMKSQKVRFMDAGWSSVKIKDLWSLWQDPGFANSERIALESVEPFDEWEELALFAGHYFLLMATTSSSFTTHISEHALIYDIPYNISPSIEVQSFVSSHGQGLRKFGAILNTNDDTVAFYGGLTSTTKQDKLDLYTRSANVEPIIATPEGLLCYTITKLDNDTALLVGGRNSPAKASASCWFLEANVWTRTQNLLPARYRHCSVAVEVGSIQGVLTFGGKTSDGQVLNEWTFFSREAGWQKVETGEFRPAPSFGAMMATTGNCAGVLVGGMSQIGILHAHFMTWELSTMEDGGLKIQFESKLPRLNQVGIASPAAMRFGASLVQSRWGVLLIGGIGPRGPLPLSEEILVLRKYGRMDQFEQLFSSTEPRPLLVGCGAATVEGGNVLIVGGSAVCFSFGAFWNDKSYLICPKEDRSLLPLWKLVASDHERTGGHDSI